MATDTPDPHYHGARLVVDDGLDRGQVVFCFDNGSRSHHNVFMQEGLHINDTALAVLEAQSHHRCPTARITSIIMSRVDFLAYTGEK